MCIYVFGDPVLIFKFCDNMYIGSSLGPRDRHGPTRARNKQAQPPARGPPQTCTGSHTQSGQQHASGREMAQEANTSPDDT